jgi:spore germination protein YaaH
MHRVGSGETLATIGKRYGVTPANIVSVNRLETAQAVEGDRLLIPSVQRVQAPVVKKTITATARRKATTRRKATVTASARPARKSPVVLAHNATN